MPSLKYFYFTSGIQFRSDLYVVLHCCPMQCEGRLLRSRFPAEALHRRIPVPDGTGSRKSGHRQAGSRIQGICVRSGAKPSTAVRTGPAALPCTKGRSVKRETLLRLWLLQAGRRRRKCRRIFRRCSIRDQFLSGKIWVFPQFGSMRHRPQEMRAVAAGGFAAMRLMLSSQKEGGPASIVLIRREA